MSVERKGQLALTWPIEQEMLSRRRSCEMTQKIAPCMEKVTTHLYELEDRLSLIRQKVDEKESNKKQSKQNDLRGKTSLSSLGEWCITKEIPALSSPRSVMSASGAKLEIQGLGFTKLQKSTPEQISSSLPEFGEFVVRETLLLLGRLETDRVNTVKALHSQRERVSQLKAKIDEYAHRRMHFLPIAVQREHELCSYNVQELKWHLAFKGRSKDRSLEKVRLAENANKSVKDELNYIQGHSPWVDLKVEEERSEMSGIQKKQNSTDTELQGALGLLKAMEDKYSDKDKMAEKEREILNEEVDEVRQELNSATEKATGKMKEKKEAERKLSDELSRYKMHHTSFVHSLNDARNKLKELAEESDVLDNRLIRAQQMEQVQEEKVARLKEKIKEQETEKFKLMEENTKLKQQKEEQTTALESQNAKLELDTKKDTQKLREIIATDRALEREIRHIRKLINDFSKQKIEGEKVIKRTLQEMTKVSGELEILQDETAKVKLVNEKLVTTMEREKEKCERVEEDLRTTADSLKKQLKDEAHARTVLQARIAADTAEFLKIKSDAGKKKDKGSKRSDEIGKSVEGIKGQVEKMEKAHAERTQVITELDALLEKLANQQRETEEKLTAEVNKLTPEERSFKDDLRRLEKKIEDMEWKTEAIEKRMQDMASSSVMMNRALLSTQETIEELTEELNELNIQLQAGQGITETLENTLQHVRDREMKGTEEHTRHMQKRNAVLIDLKDDLQKSLDENKNLAKLYTTIQNEHLIEKDRLLNVYEAALLSENSLKDKKELFDFRTRLHKALESYYKLRGIQTRAGIQRFGQLTDENSERLFNIQDSLTRTLSNIADFLETSKRSHGAIRLNAEETARSVEVTVS